MNSHREKLGEWIESERIQKWIIGIIIFNAAMLGLQTSDYLESNFGEIFDILDIAIPTIFIIEIAIKLYAFDIRFFKSGWNIFDFAIVLVTLVPETGFLKVFRSLRIFRVLRLIPKVHRMRMLVEAVLNSLPGLGWVTAILLLVYYFFGLIGTLRFGPVFPEWFGTLGNSMGTLFQIMTLDSWSTIARPVINEFPSAWLYFLFFILLATYISVNIFITIMVSTMQNLAEVKEKEAIENDIAIQDIVNMPKKEEAQLEILKNIQKRLELIEKELAFHRNK